MHRPNVIQFALIMVAPAMCTCSCSRPAMEHNTLTRDISRTCGLYPDFVAIDNDRAKTGRQSTVMSANFKSLRKRPGTLQCLRQGAEDSGYRLVDEKVAT